MSCNCATDFTNAPMRYHLLLCVLLLAYILINQLKYSCALPLNNETLESKKTSLLLTISAKMEEQKAHGFDGVSSTFFVHECFASQTLLLQEALKEVIKAIDMCYELSAQQTRFVAVSHNGAVVATKEGSTDQILPQIKLMELHAKLALKLSDQDLLSVIQVCPLVYFLKNIFI